MLVKVSGDKLQNLDAALNTQFRNFNRAADGTEAQLAENKQEDIYPGYETRWKKGDEGENKEYDEIKKRVRGLVKDMKKQEATMAARKQRAEKGEIADNCERAKRKLRAEAQWEANNNVIKWIKDKAAEKEGSTSAPTPTTQAKTSEPPECSQKPTTAAASAGNAAELQIGKSLYRQILDGP